jgi:uncharacterized small protein (DUF1192 family)
VCGNHVRAHGIKCETFEYVSSNETQDERVSELEAKIARLEAALTSTKNALELPEYKSPISRNLASFIVTNRDRPHGITLDLIDAHYNGDMTNAPKDVRDFIAAHYNAEGEAQECELCPNFYVFD